MRRLTFPLDALPALREATGNRDVNLAAAASLAELAGVDAVRLTVTEELRPVRQLDVQEARRAAQSLELRMPPTQGALKVALEGRPDLVVLASEGWDRHASGCGPIDLRGRPAGLGPVLRSLGDGGIPAVALIAPDMEAVKAAHGLGVAGVELFTGAIADLPAAERATELERLSDAARLAAKLRLSLGLSGGLGFRTLRELVDAVPAVGRVVVGRALVARSLLVGIDRAVRDLRAILG